MLELVVTDMCSTIEGEIFAGGNRCDQSGSPGRGPGGVPKVVPEVEKPFIHAAERTAGNFGHALEPPLWSHFGPPLGGPGGARISRRVPEIAQVQILWLSPLRQPSFMEEKVGLLP